MSPLLSIIIPNYNGISFLHTCLESVRAQISTDCEVIIVDDGSTDDSVKLIQKEFLEELESGKFKLIRTNNSGPGAARNIGIKAAQGDYIGFLDSDDFILPGYIENVDLVKKVDI